MKSGGMRLLAEASSRPLAGVLVTFALLVASGCAVVPVRVPSQTKDISGEPQKLDFTFLKSGSTKRDEVTNNLAVIDTRVKGNNFFWGRWESSTWGYGVVGFVPPQGGRYWGTHNVLIQFDQDGIVRNWVVVDDRNLGQQLDLFDPGAADSPLDLSARIRTKAQWLGSGSEGAELKPADIVLSAESFEYDIYDFRTASSYKLETPRANILKIAPTPGAFDVGPFFERTHFTRPTVLVATIYFVKPAVCKHDKDKRDHFCKRLALALDPPTFSLLRHYIEQTKPAPDVRASISLLHDKYL
jgi:hypothetical protein